MSRHSLRRALLLALASLAVGQAASAPGLALPVPLPVPAAPAPITGPVLPLPPQGSTAAPEPAPPPPGAAEAAPLMPLEPAIATATPTPAMTDGGEVFARLRRELNPQSCDAGSNSARWRQRYAGSPAAFSRRIESVLPLIDFVSTEVERAGLPAEFTFIPLVESWYQPAAIGPGGPAGMWQMIGTTARNHGIHIRDGYDGRLSPVESTRAALSYLKVLQRMFGDWQAIVMAYNAGEGRLQQAQRRAGSRVTSAADRRPHGLSNITYDYVAKLQALSCLVSQPHRFGLHLPENTRFEPLVPLLMGPDVRTLDDFARAHGKDAAELRRLNPGFRAGRVVAGVPRLVLSPPGASLRPAPATAVASAPLPIDAVDAPAFDGESEVAELLESALAAEFVEDDAAGMPAVDPGAEVAVAPPAFVDMVAMVESPRASEEATALPVADAIAAPEAAPTQHEVRSGESLWSIAHRYHLPIEQLRRANRLDAKATVRPGQVLRLVP